VRTMLITFHNPMIMGSLKKVGHILGW